METGFYENQEGSFETPDNILITVNNVENIYQCIEGLPRELAFENLSQPSSNNRVKHLGSTSSSGSASNSIEIDEHPNDKLFAIINSTKEFIDLTLYTILETMIGKLQEGLKKHIFHLAWSPDTLPTSDSIYPLLEFLDKYLLILSPLMLRGNYIRCLHVLWENVLSELKEHAETSTGEKMPLFFERLDDALQILADYFSIEDHGLPSNKLYSENFNKVHLDFSLNKLSTESLMDMYNRQRLEEQQSLEIFNYGVLTVRVYFNHQCLFIEVIKAKDVIPLDNNGLSDPYVIVELLPKRIFKNSHQQTRVQKATLNPIFDECFEFSVTMDQCRDPSAMIAFTVMDHDVLSFNDFGGEAYLSLNQVPGVEYSNSSVDNFHGLKPVHIPLNFQLNKDNSVLNALEARGGDRGAQEFVKKHKRRIEN